MDGRCVLLGPHGGRQALEIAQGGNFLAPLFNPPTHMGNDQGLGPARICPGSTGGVNITGPAVADPVSGVIFITSHSGCSTEVLAPGADSPLENRDQTGTTIVDFARTRGAARRGGGQRGGGRRVNSAETIDGLSIWKGPIGRISAVDLNTGEYLWVIPHGDAPAEQQEAIRTHPLLQGVEDVPTNPGRRGHSAMTVTPTLLLASGQTDDDKQNLFAIDKRTGERVGAVEIPGRTRYGLSSWMHEGTQYVIVQLNDGLAAMALP